MNRALLIAIPGALAVLLGIAIPALVPTGSELVESFSRYPVLLTHGLVGSIVLGVLVWRTLVRGRWWRRFWLVRLVVSLQGLLLFVGLASSSLLALLKQRAYPIALYSFVPKPENMLRTVWLTIALIGCTFAGAALASVILGNQAGRKGAQPGSLSVEVDAPLLPAEAGRLLRLGYVLGALGGLGSLIVIGSTGRIPLLSPDIDTVRYSQGSGLGFASLLEYELLAAIFIAGAVAVDSRLYRGRALRFAAAAGGALLLVRAERTSLLLSLVVVLIYLQYRGLRVRARWLVPLAVAGAAAVLGLGLVRYQSGPTANDPQARLVRAVLDISPEVREQATLLEVFPDRHPYLGRSAVVAIGSSILPGRALHVLGVDKATVYTDSSRDYSRILTELGGYHNSPKPIRVGLLGELWMDYGGYGVALGGLLFGGAIALVTNYRPKHRAGLLAKSVMTAMCLLALLMPLAALFPVGLMVVAPLWVARRRGGALGGPSVPRASQVREPILAAGLRSR
jgi:hypothetical protein